MRLKIVMTTEQAILPIDYRRKVMMMVKTKLEKKDSELYQRLFSKNELKHYTFSVYLPAVKFEKKKIHLTGDKQLIVNFSTNDAELLLAFYNAFVSLKKERVSWEADTQVMVTQVDTVNVFKVAQNHMKCRTLSPIVCRDHNRETQKTWFYDYRDESFEAILKRNLVIKLAEKMGKYVKYDIEHLQIIPVHMKQTVVTHYEKQINVSLGTLELKGEPYLLDEIINNGIGSLCGSGFGMLELL